MRLNKIGQKVKQINGLRSCLADENEVTHGRRRENHGIQKARRRKLDDSIEAAFSSCFDPLFPRFSGQLPEFQLYAFQRPAGPEFQRIGKFRKPL
jgi:hypothetical protein